MEGWLALSERGRCREEPKSLFDNGHGVGELIEDVRVVVDEVGGLGQVSAKDRVVLRAELSCDIGMGAKEVENVGESTACCVVTCFA